MTATGDADLVAALRLRAALLSRIRAFFAERNVLEVETPALSRYAATDPHLNSLTTQLTCKPDQTLYLHTSPEFAMKRLLAAGSGDIYQVCRVFRDGELGPRHEPEFTLLEWYRVDWTDFDLMAEVEVLLRTLLQGFRPLGDWHQLTYEDAFGERVGLGMGASREDLFKAAEKHALTPPPECSHAQLVDLLFGTVVAPTLGHRGPCGVTDFPPEQAALARLRQNGTSAARFEVFVDGLELANGFHELIDAEEQRARFDAELAQRRQSGLPEVPYDLDFLAALESGLPECAGVAVGVDRVIMLAGKHTDIADVLAFPMARD